VREIKTLNSTYYVEGNMVRRSEPTSDLKQHPLADGEWHQFDSEHDIHNERAFVLTDPSGVVRTSFVISEKEVAL